MKVALLIGRCVPGKCGVGDYTVRLAESLRNAGVEAEVINTGDWDTAHALKQKRAFSEFDIRHVQYPTAGFGRSLGPQLFSMLSPTVTTIHEASQRKFLRKVSLLPFALRSQHLIFTSNFERRFAIRFAPWIARHSSVIPVGTNIRVAPSERASVSSEIVYFGLIMPNKGLEQVLGLASLIKNAGLSHTINIAGQVPIGHEAYFQRLRNQASGLPVVWSQNLSDEQVAQVLNRSCVAYLPYPDGASDRRTTLKSAMAAGLAIITNQGAHTNSALANSVHLSGNPQEALKGIQRLFENAEVRETLSKRAIEYSRRFSWQRIARLHLKIYRAVAPAAK